MKTKICVVGLGYVGLPLARLFSTKYETVGFDMNQSRVDALNAGHDATLEVSDELLQTAVANGFKCTTNIEDIRDCNVYIVAVPTPVDENNRPDLRPLWGASETVGKVISQGNVVIYESTVYPGVTEEECLPVVEKVSGLKFNIDFFAGYSPERINPGDKQHTVEKIKKVTSGSTPEIADFVDELYGSVLVNGTHKAPSIRVAEASKIIENSQRDVNIAFMNELAKIFNAMGLDTHDVIEAASSKWNFIKLSPGLVGGHCISVDPYYLIQFLQFNMFFFQHSHSHPTANVNPNQIRDNLISDCHCRTDGTAGASMDIRHQPDLLAFRKLLVTKLHHLADARLVDQIRIDCRICIFSLNLNHCFLLLLRYRHFLPDTGNLQALP